jgi:signal transduction histidine kinase
VSSSPSRFGLRSLAARLVVSYVALIVATTTLAGVGILGLTRRYFVDAERQSMLVQARVVAASCDDACIAAGAASAASPPVDARSLPPASNISRDQTNDATNLAMQQRSTAQQGIQAVLPSNIVIVGRPVATASLSGPVADALGGEERSTVSGDVVRAAAPVFRDGAVVAAVEATGTLDNVDAVVSDIRRQVVLSVVLASALATVIGIWRARAIARPVKNLTRAAHELSLGTFDTPFPRPNSSDEIGELTRAFDSMRNTVSSELRARSAFVADASHELRTPLTAMRGAVEILLSDAGGRPEVRSRFLSSLQTEMDRLLQLVERLLSLNQAEHVTLGAGAHTQSAVDMVEVARSVVTDLLPLATERSLEIRLSCPQADCNVMGDRSQIRQVVTNLIDNAMVHAPEGKHVDVAIFTTGSDVILEVRDFGNGIASADRQRVFDRFTRLDAARSRSRSIPGALDSGAGLGLAIARAIVVQHNATIAFVDPPDAAGGALARVIWPAYALNH